MVPSSPVAPEATKRSIGSTLWDGTGRLGEAEGIASTSTTPEADEPLPLQTRLLRMLAVAAALAMVLFWIWILTGGPKKANPDRLDDRAYAAATEERCQQLRTDIAELPTAQEIDDAGDRAAVLDRATDQVVAMIDELSSKAPTDGSDGPSLDKWFEDWRSYIGDRRAYADQLRNDPDARFQITENAELGDGVDKTIEIFADVNDMPACATPGDVG